MAYRFRRKDHSVAHAVRRIAREQIERALSAIDDEPDRAIAVHEVRQRCKKLRGLIRLVRPSFEGYADENAEFREAGDLLGPTREATVVCETYRRFAQRCESIRPEARPRVRQTPAIQDNAECDGEVFDAVRDRLARARERIGGWVLVGDDWEAIGPGLMQAYILARTALDRIGTSHSAALYHELRKRVKYHWHHLVLLTRIRPKEMRERADLAAQLGDRLGAHHDLKLLESRLRQAPDAFGSAHEVEGVRLLARRERMLVEGDSLRLARRLLAGGAADLDERLASYWHRWLKQ